MNNPDPTINSAHAHQAVALRFGSRTAIASWDAYKRRNRTA